MSFSNGRGLGKEFIFVVKKRCTGLFCRDKSCRFNPLSVKVMSEVGVDISAQSSDPISKFDLTTFNFCVTVCSDADKHCPILSPQIKKNWPLEDPAAFDGSLDERYSMFRRSRDEIGILVSEFIGSFFLNTEGTYSLHFFISTYS